MKTINFNDSKGRTIKVPLDKKDDIIYFLQKGYDYDKSFGAINFNDSKGRTIKVPLDKKDDIIYFLQKGYDFTPIEEERGLLDKTKNIGKHFVSGSTNMLDAILDLAELGTNNPTPNVQSIGDMSFSPDLGLLDIKSVNKDNIDNIPQAPNIFSKENFGRVTDYSQRKANEYGINLVPETENLGMVEQALATGANFIGGSLIPGMGIVGKGMNAGKAFNTAKNIGMFGAGSGIYQNLGVNPIVADLLTAGMNPLNAPKTIGKVVKNPKESIVYPLARRKVGDIDADAAETSARLLGDNTASLDNFRTGEGLDSLSSNLAHIGSRGYKNQQANSLNAFNSKLDEIGQNIGGTSQELKEVYTPLYERVKKEAAEVPSQRLDEYTEFLEKIKKDVDTPNKIGTTEGEIYNDTNSQLSDFYGKEYIETADKIKQIPKPIEAPQIIKMIQNNNEKLGGKYYKGKPFISDATKHSNYLKESNLVLDKILEKILPKETYQTLKEANKTVGQGKSRDSFERLLDPTFDYAGNRLKIDKTARMLNTPKDIKALKALAKKEDHPILDDLAKISQRIYKTNAKNAGRTGSGQTKTGEEVAYEAAKAAIETAITGKTPTGILPLVTRYTYGQVMGDLMVSPKFRDYMIRVSKNPKDTQAKLAMNAMIQKKTGLTTKQLSTIIARDSVNKLTIDKNEESGK
jgi:hypothetical protein